MTSKEPLRCVCGDKDKPSLSRTLVPVAPAILLFALLSTSSHANWHGGTEAHMGTEVSVYLWHDDDETGQEAVDAVFREVERLDKLMSTYMADSMISAVNREAAEHPVEVSEELFRLITRSLDISVLTRGAFDITFDSVGQHYDFREHRRPDDATISAELTHLNYRLVEANAHDRTIRFLERGVRINLGGIAKGYAVERGIEVVRQYGVRHARVTAGGDSRLLGDRRGQPWVIGVQHPRDPEKIAVTLPLENEAISTSGDYERFFEEGGERYHHIIVPSTGRPAGEVNSTTIIGPDAVLTDALSTSVFVMGVDEGLRLIAALPDYEGIVIDSQGRMFYSDGLKPPE